MTTSPKLTDAQLVLLSSGAQRNDGLVVLPDKLKGGAAKASVLKLLSLGLTEELPVNLDDPHWRRDENDHAIGLKLTRAGLLALGIEPDDEAREDGESETQAAGPLSAASWKPEQDRENSQPPSARAPREGSKQALVLSLLSRPEGATIDDLIRATGWLPHTTRAALTGLRQKGFGLAKSKNQADSTVYRTEAPPAATVEAAANDPRTGRVDSSHDSAAGHGEAA